MIRLTGCLLLTATLAATQGLNRPPVRGLTATDELGHARDAIFDARFGDVPALLSRTCGPAPREACQLLDALNIWWQIQLDPHNRSRDAALESRLEPLITATEAWTSREPHRAEAWFYLGGAYGTRVQLRVLRGARLAAARDGARIKEALERAIALDPTMADAQFGIGLYHYYAAVAPIGARMLRWLLLLPGGNRTQGLEEMNRARTDGVLVRDEADYQMHILYVWYEKQPLRALELLADLTERHPRNPHFQQRAAEIQDFYVDDTAASLRTWQALLEAASRGEVEAPLMAEASAHLGIASQFDQLSQGEEALPHLQAVIRSRPTAPFAAVARAYLQLGEVLTRLGRRGEAAAAYRAAIDEADADDPLQITTRAREALRALR